MFVGLMKCRKASPEDELHPTVPWPRKLTFGIHKPCPFSC